VAALALLVAWHCYDVHLQRMIARYDDEARRRAELEEDYERVVGRLTRPAKCGQE